MAKKLKKALKGIAKVALPAVALAALMKGKQGKGSNKFLASGAAGGQRLPKMDLATARKIMTQNNAYRNSMLNNPFGGMMTEKDMASDPMFLNAMKKGGRVKKTKGFSKTKKKQANRMRKK